MEVELGRWVDGALDGLPDRERVRVDLAGGTTFVRGPARGLERALRVVLMNALQASPPGSEVALRARHAGNAVAVEVEDRGAGMAPDVLARAGEPFFTTKAPGQGSGLGLFIARSLAEQLGGSLELQSRHGLGTTARITLPAVPSGREEATG